VDRLLHLFQMSPATETRAKVQMEPNGLAERHRTFKVVRDDFDEFLAGHPPGQILLVKVNCAAIPRDQFLAGPGFARDQRR
jgi:hypothetical protein